MGLKCFVARKCSHIMLVLLYHISSSSHNILERQKTNELVFEIPDFNDYVQYGSIKAYGC